MTFAKGVDASRVFLFCSVKVLSVTVAIAQSAQMKIMIALMILVLRNAVIGVDLRIVLIMHCKNVSNMGRLTVQIAIKEPRQSFWSATNWQ